MLITALSNMALSAPSVLAAEDGPVWVTETETSIQIEANICYEGLAEETVSCGQQKVTYKDAFEIGVKTVWEGMYRGKNVTVTLNEVPSESEQEKVTVIFCSVTETGADSECYPKAAKALHTIWMYTGDGRNNTSYDYNTIVNYLAGHEFGHILGLRDVYTESSELVRSSMMSPMSSQTFHHAQNIDYYIMLRYRTWEQDDFTVNYSDDQFAVMTGVIWKNLLDPTSNQTLAFIYDTLTQRKG